MRCAWAARCVVVAKDLALLDDSVALRGRAIHATRDEPLPIARRTIGSFLVYSSQSADCEQAFGYAEECKKHIHDQRDSQLIEQYLLVAMNGPSVTDAQSSGIIDRAQNSFAHEASRNDRARPGEFYQRGRSMVQRKRALRHDAGEKGVRKYVMKKRYSRLKNAPTIRGLAKCPDDELMAPIARLDQDSAVGWPLPDILREHSPRKRRPRALYASSAEEGM